MSGLERQGKDTKPESEKGNALQAEAQEGLNPRVRISGDKAELLYTRTAAEKGTRIGPSDPNQQIDVTVMVKSKGSEQEMEDTLQKILEGKKKPLTDAQFNAQFGADKDAMNRVLKFAKDSGLKAVKIDTKSGRIQLHGKVGDFSKAFNVQLDDYQNDGVICRERAGNVMVPRAMSDDIQGIFGLDNPKMLNTHFKQAPKGDSQPRADNSFMPNEVADMYNFPKDSMGGGQSVAIVEFGGGLDFKDNSKYYKDHGLKEPKIQVVEIGTAKNKPGDPADGEVALDSQVIGAIAPDAKQQLIFAPNSDQGFLDAITRATFAEKNEIQNSAISISWGAPESDWNEQAIRNLNIAFKKAALKGISIFAASGDDGAKDKSSDGKFTPDYPASDPFVTGTGGTRLEKSGKEVTWNDGFFGGSTGGGISAKFDVPEFQKNITMPQNANNTGKPGRGAPDIAGNASSLTGYKIRVGGAETVTGGTSAVAPLYAGLMMRVNGALGRPAGYLNPILYNNANSGIFKDITEGHNNGYDTGPGWDATTGWGVLRGDKFLELLRKQQIVEQQNSDSQLKK